MTWSNAASGELSGLVETPPSNPGHPTPSGAKDDPYDPERRKHRRLAGPRLVDFAQPMPPPDPGPAVARPYAPQVRIKDDAVVPPEDNPLRGWRWLGARLLSRDLWPREAITNPVMVYYSGKKRGRLLEDFLGLAPWLMLIAFDAFMIFGVAKSFDSVRALIVSEFIVVGIGAAILSSAMAATHLRRTMTHLPLEEMLLTRLKPLDIVQGLAIRPMAVQSAGLFFWSVCSLGFACMRALDFAGAPTSVIFTFSVCAIFFRYYMLGVAIEIGSAFAMRAHLCIRSPLFAAIRTMFDMLALFAVLLVFGGLALLMVFVISIFGIAVSVFLPVVAVFAVFFGLFAAGSFLNTMLRGVASDAMDWCHLNPGEWWVILAPSAGDNVTEERGLLTPWRPIAPDQDAYLKPLRKHVPREPKPGKSKTER